MSKTLFVDGDPSQGILGTQLLAAFLNKIFTHRHTGRDIDGDGALDYAVATGSANAYAIALSPALDAYITGMPIMFMANHDNNGAATLNVNGLGAISLKKYINQNLVAGDIRNGQLVVGIYDGSAIQIVSVLCALAVEAASAVNQDLTTDAGPTFDHLHLTSGQIGFPASQVASSDPNTLDDYEEGSTTATLTCGTSGTITLDAGGKTLRYVKTGSKVTVTGYVYVSSISSPVGTLTLGGLPFAAGATSSNRSAAAIEGSAWASTATKLGASLLDGASVVPIYTRFASGSFASNASDVSANAFFYISLTYLV